MSTIRCPGGLLRDSRLFRLLKKHIPAEILAALRNALRPESPVEYETAVGAIRSALPQLQEQAARHQRRVEELCQDVGKMPSSRLQLLLEDSPPTLLVALSCHFIRESYGARFDNPKRSLLLAQVGLRAAEQIRGGSFFDEAAQADLEGEAWLYLGNARRINSDLRGAEKAFGQAEKRLSSGTGDRILRADAFQLQGHFRFSQGRADEAAELFSREIRLRRLLGDPEALGQALINRGIVAAWSGPLPDACLLFEEGVVLIEDKDYLILSAHAIAERLARDGHGVLAWKAICQAETAVALVGGEAHKLRSRWIQGLALRALGDLSGAERSLRFVRQQHTQDGTLFRAALASLDLAAVYVAQHRWQDVQEVVEEAYAVFVAERLERRALGAFLAFRLAARAETLTEELAVRVANFLVRSQYDKSLRFDGPSEP